MKKAEFTKHLAERGNLSEADAADQLDRVVGELLDRARQGKAVSLPGLGTFIPGKEAPVKPSVRRKRAGKR